MELSRFLQESPLAFRDHCVQLHHLLDVVQLGDARMKRKEIEESLCKAAGGSSFISINGLRKWYGKRHEAVLKLVKDLEYLEDGKAKRYFIGDVANEVVKQRRNDYEVKR